MISTTSPIAAKNLLHCIITIIKYMHNINIPGSYPESQTHFFGRWEGQGREFFDGDFFVPVPSRGYVPVIDLIQYNLLQYIRIQSNRTFALCRKEWLADNEKALRCNWPNLSLHYNER